MSLVRVFCLIVCLILPISVFAAGGHDSLLCTGCHGIHTAKDTIIFAVPANKVDTNPRTKQTYSIITALCLGCHQTPEKGGMGIKPIAGHMSHPYGFIGINPKVARVPEGALRDGRFECVSCHDPHPSNQNYKYLRYDAGANGSKMDAFCAVCHPMKADPKSVAMKPKGFDSMDERLFKSEDTVTSKEAPKQKKK